MPASFLHEWWKWWEWCLPYTLSFLENPDLRLNIYQDSWKVLVWLPATKLTDMTEVSAFVLCHRKQPSSLSETDSSGTALSPIPSIHAAPWLSFLLVSSLSSGSFPSTFKHAQVSASLKKQVRNLDPLLHVLPLIFTMTVFLSHPNSLAPLLCLLFKPNIHSKPTWFICQPPCWDLRSLIKSRIDTISVLLELTGWRGWQTLIK